MWIPPKRTRFRDPDGVGGVGELAAVWLGEVLNELVDSWVGRDELLRPTELVQLAPGVHEWADERRLDCRGEGDVFLADRVLGHKRAKEKRLKKLDLGVD